jgi:hypothetical protein
VKSNDESAVPVEPQRVEQGNRRIGFLPAFLMALFAALAAVPFGYEMLRMLTTPPAGPN